MKQPEAQAAWRLFSYNWVVLGLMAVVFVFGLAFTGFSIKLASALKPFLIVSAYIGYTYFRVRWPQCDPKVIFILGSTGQITLITVLMTPLTYVAASANLPLQDVALDAIDHALGLDWMGFFNFVYNHYALLYCTVLAYDLIGWPIFGVPIALGATKRYRRLQEFTLAFALALVVTTFISVFVPATGTYDLLNFRPDPDVFIPGAYLEQLDVMPRVRDGALRVIDFSNLTGLVTFPSFHAAAAVLYLWALWPVRWLGPIAAVVNITMILGTPLGGGHYFIDIFAGIGIAAGSIIAAQWISRRLLQPGAPIKQSTQVAAGVPAE